MSGVYGSNDKAMLIQNVPIIVYRGYMAFGNLARAFLDLVFGRNVGRGGPTASSARDAIMNNRPLPTASQPPPLPRNAGGQPPPLPEFTLATERDKREIRVGRWTNPEMGVPTGIWVLPTSTWIYKFRFDYYPGEEERTDVLPHLRKGEILVQFLSLAMVRYNHVPLGQWMLLFGAPSKGKWLYGAAIRRRDPWTQGYTLIIPARRKVTAAMRQANG